MHNLSENYYLRKSFFQRDAVPTQSLMKEKMTPALANVYFKSMTHDLKILAGLEPPLKGGGSNWYMPPEEVLNGRAVLKPLKNEIKEKLNFIGIDTIGMRLTEIHRKRMDMEKSRTLKEGDALWRKKVLDDCDHIYKEHTAFEDEYNKNQMIMALNQFTTMYSSSITKFQDLLFDAAVDKIKKIREETFQKMYSKYERLLKQQAILLYDDYTAKLATEKARLKAEFIENIETIRTELGDKLHNINLEKHVAVEKLRKYLECRNLACLVYIALKERQECLNETEFMEYKHAKTINTLRNELLSAEFEIRLAQEKEKRQREFNTMWIRKVCYVVKEFQLFVSYCLKKLPEHADFFINMEKLMLLQLNDVIENPNSESIYKEENPEQDYQVLKPRMSPFYLFCDKSNIRDKPMVNENLCPKHCSSSATQLPAIIINKSCIYAACDNFEQFTDKIKDYVLLNRRTDDDLIDNHEYHYDVPVEYSSSQQLRELKLESSLLQVLQQEIANLKGVSTECRGCELPHCFGCSQTPSSLSVAPSKTKVINETPSLPSFSSGNKILTRKGELDTERGPKWESYMQYVKPRKCDCTKLAKKHLLEHLPSYMRTMSDYSEPELLNYETCSFDTLRTLVKKARRRKISPALPPTESKTKEIGTQIDDDFDFLCFCLADDELNDFFKRLMPENSYLSHYDRRFNVVGSSLSQTFLSKEKESFAARRALSLKRLIHKSPEIEEIFKAKDCYHYV